MKILSKNPKGCEHQNQQCTKLSKTSSNYIRQDFFNKFDYIFLTILAIILLLYILSNFEEFSWQLSSFGRIILIKILPYFDWRPYKNKRCLIEHFFTETETLSNKLNCNVCEDLVGIDVHEILEEDILEERYIKLDNPVIITKSLKNWPKDSRFMNDLIQHESSKLYPCNLSTNIHKGLDNLETVLSKLKYFNEFYIHYQNCESEAMRTLRQYTFTPEVLPSIFSPTLYNWMIWNDNYNATNYKQIELMEKVTVVGQLFGSTNIRLIPRKNCAKSCPFFDIILRERELLIFTSLWDLEYRPADKGENMAVIIEYSD
ncbi:uncharacterized protein LOC130895945 [Diorhabda carinulata]|uniref:uncharacterized protein LOC130895945 n=1 Tax=Diorhabda carinulata TaxID=1163345 RepID=UPI0025A0346E|nr:uncharacterized protein LOC130895945 [Diorhabda carinulata]